MLAEIASLGFTHVELSHGIRITLVPGILRAVEAGVVRISSTHNFCPLPTGANRAAPNLYEPSALDRREHEQWVRHTLRSIDFAAQVKASALVCHLGRVRFRWFNPGTKLRKYLAGVPGTSRDARKHAALVQQCVHKLREKMPPYWTQVRAAVDAVLAHAQRTHVHLGFENREKFEELPLDPDLPGFLQSFGADAPVGYWHDTGHAHLKEEMGVSQQRVQLEALARRTLGFHLHDVDADGHDHQSIGSGRVDFEMVSRFWRPEHVLTLELSPRASVDQVRESKQKLEALMA